MKNLKWFARPDKFKNRLIMVILGVLIQGFGLSWIIEVSFGTDPCSAFTQGVISHVPLSFGTAQLLINIILFVVVFLADTSLIGFGTIANMVFIGYISDFCRFIYSKHCRQNFSKHNYKNNHTNPGTHSIHTRCGDVHDGGTGNLAI